MISTFDIKGLEDKLDSFNGQERKEGLNLLLEETKRGRISLPRSKGIVNLHCHTFFSYNCYGYSPTKFAWLARREGMEVAGIMDFDVLDGVEEFLEAARFIGLKACGGMETRVFVPEFADKVINSPGEPGIAYHIGHGFPGPGLKGWLKDFAARLKDIAQKRNKVLIERVNTYLSPAEIDYERDVVSLTPAGNPTERHICLAFARKAGSIFDEKNELEKFWSEKLGTHLSGLDIPEGHKLLDAIRAKTMKRGGVGYVQPDRGSFPKLKEMNRFILEAGGIPTLAWLNGFSDAEKDIRGLLDVAMSSGVTAVNIIPDRNFTPGVKDERLDNLYKIVELTERLDLPVFVGTEMNSSGQKFVDDFKSSELTALLPVFMKGAHIVYAHSVLQRKCGLGYTSRWAEKNFRDRHARNDFYRKVGEVLSPFEEGVLDGVSVGAEPRDIITKISR